MVEELQNKDNLLFFTNGSYSMSKNENQISFRVPALRLEAVPSLYCEVILFSSKSSSNTLKFKILKSYLGSIIIK